MAIVSPFYISSLLLNRCRLSQLLRRRESDFYIQNYAMCFPCFPVRFLWLYLTSCFVITAVKRGCWKTKGVERGVLEALKNKEQGQFSLLLCFASTFFYGQDHSSNSLNFHVYNWIPVDILDLCREPPNYHYISFFQNRIYIACTPTIQDIKNLRVVYWHATFYRCAHLFIISSLLLPILWTSLAHICLQLPTVL